MTVRVYYSTDASAPQLTGQSGTLISILDACLVTGYGAKSPAGWTKPYTATNVAVFRQGAGNFRYLRVDDTSTIAALVYGYESMSSVDTGINRMPGPAQTDASYWRKTSTSDATVRDWVVVATETNVMVWANGNGNLNQSQVGYFGDLTSYRPGDMYNTIIIGESSSTYATTSYFAQGVSSIDTSQLGHYLCRSVTQIGQCRPCNKITDAVRATYNPMGNGSLTYPDPATGGLVLSPIWIGEAIGSTYGVRGVLPGIWNICHNSPTATYDTFSGAVGTGLAGKTFMSLSVYSTGCFAIEISDTW